MKRLGRKLMVPAFGAVVAAGGFAFLASNNVGASSAGNGDASISGYTVSDISYTHIPDDRSPGYAVISSVTFTLDKAASQVTANIYQGTGDGHGDGGVYVPYDNCSLDTTATNPNTWTCTFGASPNQAPGYGTAPAQLSQAGLLTVSANS